MLIDFHTHCFPDNLCAKAIQKLSYVSGNIETCTDGSLSGLLNSMKKNGVDTSVVLNIATNPAQQTKVNDFAASINNRQNIFSFGSVHPDSPCIYEELERIKEIGLLGVKFHPDYQDFESDDPKMKPIYQKISKLGLITVFHTGLDYGFAPPYKNMPKAMAKAASWFDSPVVAAHWGGLNCNDDVVKYLCASTDNLYIDLSFGYCSMPKAYASMIIEKHGIDKLLFATDTPWHSADMEMRFISSLDLSDEEKDKIFYKNACRLLNLDA